MSGEDPVPNETPAEIMSMERKRSSTFQPDEETRIESKNDAESGRMILDS